MWKRPISSSSAIILACGLSNITHAFIVAPSHTRKGLVRSFTVTQGFHKQQQQQHYSSSRHLLWSSNKGDNITPDLDDPVESDAAPDPTVPRMMEKTTLMNDTSTTSTTTTNVITLPDKDNKDETYSIAIRNTLLSVGAALAFGAGLWVTVGSVTGQEFFAGYLVEQSLSVDNLFVFLLLFEFFKVPLEYQNRILNYGIYGAVVMRAIMIGLGAAALQNFHGILLVFAAILIYSAARVLLDVEDEEDDLNENSVVRFSRSLFPSTDQYDGDRFFTTVDGNQMATPLLICMVAVELSDVVFAVDSIPAVFGVTENPLVVFSSNMFAIIGLRSLYTVLSKAAADLLYLEEAVAVVLAFIGSKMIAEYFGYIVPTKVALAVVVSVLALGVGASIYEKRRGHKEDNEPPA